MPLPTSGTITMAQINAEFGRGNNLNSYRGTQWYTAAGGSGTFPTGAISFSDFYGKQLASPSFSFTISSHIDQANLRTLAVNAGWNQSSPVTATLASGYYIYSTNTGVAALTINGSFPGGVTLVNNGYIMGMGGHGGGYYTDAASTPTYIGNWQLSAGGPAISLGVSCTIQNNAYIGGGGGGGGCTQGVNAQGNSIGGGGGGAGGGAGGNIQNGPTLYYSGGGGGGLGAGGGNGTGYGTGAAYVFGGGGGGGRVMPGGRTNGPVVTYGGGSGTGGYGAEPSVSGGTGSYSGTPSGAAYSGTGVGGYGGSAGGTGAAGAGSPYGTNQGGGGGGGGWGASGGTGNGNYTYITAALASGNGASGGKCANLNGYSITWSATGNRYGGIS